MFRPQIQKTRTLVCIAIFNILLVWWSANSKTKLDNEYTLSSKDKIEAVKIMRSAITKLKEHPKYKISDDDIYQTGLIGKRTSSITTKQDNEGIMLKSKLACSHPNFAAQMVVYLNEAGLKTGDIVAVGMTGSFPGANLAILSACQAMGIKTVSISSVGSSAWGANRPEFTWPEIENYLYDSKILDYRSVAYSVGGKNDIGGSVKDSENEIKEKIEKIIKFFKEVDYINIPLSSDGDNILERMNYYDSEKNIFAAYINIGGGVASLGLNDMDLIEEGEIDEIEESNEKDQLIGVLKFGLDVSDESLEDWDNSVVSEFFKKELPVINIRDIPKLLSGTGLYPEDKNIKDLEGPLFSSYKAYNIYVIIVSLILSLLVIISVGVYSHIQIKRRMESYD